MKSLQRRLQCFQDPSFWQHPLTVLLVAIRRFCRLFIDWDALDVFETDLRMPLPESYSNEKLDVRIYRGNGGLKRAVEDLTSFNDLLPADIEPKFARGDVVTVAYSAGEVIGCAWLAFANGIEHVFGTSWIIRPTEALRYDSHVRRDWRGRAIHSVLNATMKRYALEHGILRTLGENQCIQ
jgi:hypothetical protein